MAAVIVVILGLSALLVWLSAPLALGAISLAFLLLIIWLSIRDSRIKTIQREGPSQEEETIAGKNSRQEEIAREKRQLELVWWGLAPILTVIPLFALLYYYFSN